MNSPATSKTELLELRRPLLIHALLLLAAWLTYLFDPTDAVWRFIRNSPQPRLLEHLSFAAAAAAIGAGILLGAWRSDLDSAAEGWTPRAIRSRCAGEILNAIGIGSLLPLAGFVLLVGGETLRSLRYAQLKLGTARNGPHPTVRPALPAWSGRILSQAGMACALISMTIFSIVLVDRVADALFGVTLLVWNVTRLALARADRRGRH